jgi:uncharacterized repeat protein (TIGR01451 family)
MHKSFFPVIFLLLCLSLFSDRSVFANQTKIERKFVNGGLATNLMDAAEIGGKAESILPGTTFALWMDTALGLNQGPAIANRTITKIANKLISEVTFQTLETQTAQQGLIGTVAKKEFLTRSQSYSAQSESVLFKLIEVVKANSLKSELTIKNILEFYKNNKLLSTDELSQLYAIIQAGGLNEDQSIEDLLGYLRSSKLAFSLSTATYEILQQRYRFDSIETRTSAETIVKSTEISSRSDSRQLETIVSSGPQMQLNKSVDKEYVWFGSKLTYTIEFENKGTMAAAELVIVDVLPIGLKFQRIESESHDTDFTCVDTKQSQALFFSIEGRIEPKEKGSVVFSVTVKRE